MTLRYLVVGLATIMLTSLFNDVQCSIPHSEAQNHLDDHTDLINEVKDNANAHLADFHKVIKNYKEEIEKLRSLHPGINEDKQLVLKIRDVVQGHVKSVIQSRIKDKINLIKSAKDNITLNILNLTNVIKKYGKEIEQLHSLPTNANESEQLSCKIKEVIQSHVKNIVQNHVKEKINEIVNSGKLLDRVIDSAQTVYDLAEKQKINKQSEERNHDRREQSHNEKNEREQSDHRNHHGSAKLDDLNHQLKEQSKSNERDRRYHSSDNDETESRVQIQSLAHDIAGIVSELRSRTTDETLDNKALFESQLHKKFDILRRAVQSSLVQAGNNNDGTSSREDSNTPRAIVTDEAVSDENNINEFVNNEIRGTGLKHVTSETGARRIFTEQLRERFRSDITKLQSSKQAFIDAKEEMSEFANKLNTGDKHIDRTVYFQLLTALKLKINEMILKKAQYVKEKTLLNHKIKQALKEFHVTESSSESDSTSPNTLTILPIAINSPPPRDSQNKDRTNEDVDISESERLNMAAANRASADHDDGSTVVVVVVVLACLVISAVVGVFSLVVWRRYRRQRLYARIPSGPVSSTKENYHK